MHVGGVTADRRSTPPTTPRPGCRCSSAASSALSFLLLLDVFRSVAVAVKAALLNLLSLAAAYGVVALVLQGGWAGQLIGIDTETPLPAFIPVLMFAVLFGLSMDYEVFLLTRIREQWLRTGDNSRSVADGLAATARVVTAAAAIMVAVFAAFVPSPQVFLKVIGVGMAAAILIDATDRPDAAGAGGDAAARPGQLVAAGLAGPDAAAGAGRGRGRPRARRRRRRRHRRRSLEPAAEPPLTGRPGWSPAPAPAASPGGRQRCRRRRSASAVARRRRRPRRARARSGTPTFAALRPVRKSRTSQPRARAIRRSALSGLTATAVPDRGEHRQVVDGVAVRGAAVAGRAPPGRPARGPPSALAGPCSSSPTSRPV